MSNKTEIRSGWCTIPTVRSLHETVRNVKTHYVFAGEGEPVVLLHGGGPGASGATGWPNTIPALAEHYQVFAPDLIGFGDTDKPMVEYSLQTLVEHVAGFIDELGLTNVRIMGSSQGAYCAIKYALDNPGRVKAVAMLSTGNVATACGIESAAESAERTKKFLKHFDTVQQSPRESVRAFLEMIVNDKSKITEELLDERVRTAEMPGHMHMLDSLKRYRKLAAEDPSYDQLRRLGDRLKGFKIPTCFIWGEEDRTAPLDPLGYGLREKFPEFPFHIVAGSGHQVQNDRAEECNRLLLKHFAAA
jgi:pimeloyl-ACP methyl ester carboxylesterase